MGMSWTYLARVQGIYILIYQDILDIPIDIRAYQDLGRGREGKSSSAPVSRDLPSGHL
eukprot:jgi/Botrbrau1/8943/Bobra.0148s0056.1